VQHHLMRDDCWIHVFEEAAFGGRGTVFGLGECAKVGKIRSIIVGPGAIAKVVLGNGKEVTSFPPRKVVADLSKLRLQKPIAYIRVAKM
jgi:hypothetical protein